MAQPWYHTPMQFKLTSKIQSGSIVALSGGSDSMFVLHFLLSGRKSPKALYFNHGTVHGAEAQTFVENECKKLGVELIVKQLSALKSGKQSPEEYWRDERYKAFSQFSEPVITGHHLNDAIEWWVMSSLHGEGRLIPVKNNNVIRPFLMLDKKDIMSYIARKGIEYIDDPSNNDCKYRRNHVRHVLMPEVLKINPGIASVIRKKYLEII